MAHPSDRNIVMLATCGGIVLRGLDDVQTFAVIDGSDVLPICAYDFLLP
jgi:hypothetical protein